jgi:hypothetical protein
MLSNYPDGLSDSTIGAPWNEESVPEKDFEVTCSQSLSKTVTIWTDNYIPGASGVDYEPDGEGGYCACGWHDPDDTSDTNWAEEYHYNDHYTPLQLIGLFKQCLEETLKNGLVFQTPGVTKRLIEECDGWTEDETEYIEN